MATNPEAPPLTLSFGFRESVSNPQVHKWAPKNAKLPASLQALTEELPFQGPYDALFIWMISPTDQESWVVYLGNEAQYQRTMNEIYQTIQEHPTSQPHDMPERYWLFQIIVSPSIDDDVLNTTVLSTELPQALPTELPQESESQLIQPKAAFTCFNRLPTELQEAIWLFSLPTQQITHIKHMKEPGLRIQPPPLPTSILACQQSYEVALRHYKRLPWPDREGETKTVFFNIETGILLLDHLEYPTDIGDAEYDEECCWCEYDGFHSHLNDRSHPWHSFRFIANFLG
ncbi:hypothetical protein EDB81DRAFT_484431 [Dactylonectria macrodidyma]|uniref:2EXR domain-containing protein n=1 Tax=Dactylonectria macrodidyma TaxID=307937 RepID=A0A9P9EVG3_9HYPO|nr:hypothetical protein EDB81DRAFT_484431 [Dactylonectria macrodidyma]